MIHVFLVLLTVNASAQTCSPCDQAKAGADVICNLNPAANPRAARTDIQRAKELKEGNEAAFTLGIRAQQIPSLPVRARETERAALSRAGIQRETSDSCRAASDKAKKECVSPCQYSAQHRTDHLEKSMQLRIQAAEEGKFAATNREQYLRANNMHDSDMRRWEGEQTLNDPYNVPAQNPGLQNGNLPGNTENLIQSGNMMYLPNTEAARELSGASE